MSNLRPLAASLSLALALSALVPACGGGRERRAERVDDRRDRRVEAMTGWEKLGERMVQGGRDVDAIGVTSSEGKFGRVMLKVEHSALEMFDLRITFGDGSHFSPPTRLIFSEETRSREIDLPGARRVIRKVEFRYGNLPGGGRAQIELWAQ